jgi:hypothetical protein
VRCLYGLAVSFRYGTELGCVLLSSEFRTEKHIDAYLPPIQRESMTTEAVSHWLLGRRCTNIKSSRSFCSSKCRHAGRVYRVTHDIARPLACATLLPLPTLRHCLSNTTFLSPTHLVPSIACKLERVPLTAFTVQAIWPGSTARSQPERRASRPSTNPLHVTALSAEPKLTNPQTCRNYSKSRQPDLTSSKL